MILLKNEKFNMSQKNALFMSLQIMIGGKVLIDVRLKLFQG